MDDASLSQDQGMNMGGDQSMGGDPMGGDPMGGDPNAMGGDPNAMGGDPNAMGGDPNAMGGDPMGDEPMDDEPMDGEDFDENPDSSEDEKVKYGTSIFKGLSPQNQDTAIAYMQSMENTEDDGSESPVGDSQSAPEDGGMPQDDQGGAEQGQPLMEMILTKKQVKKLSEALMQTDTKNNERDNRKPLDKKQSKGGSKSPFNSPKFN